jgi:catechol 2,3-dioxygenase-like lactoylglutathione lyase family enzyme
VPSSIRVPRRIRDPDGNFWIEPSRAIWHYGRTFWKRCTGYHDRSRTEAKKRCLKAFGEHIAARDPDRQTFEIQIRVALMTRFSALGTAEIVRVA